jgi:hypothetical protein
MLQIWRGKGRWRCSHCICHIPWLPSSPITTSDGSGLLPHQLDSTCGTGPALPSDSLRFAIALLLFPISACHVSFRRRLLVPPCYSSDLWIRKLEAVVCLIGKLKDKLNLVLPQMRLKFWDSTTGVCEVLKDSKSFLLCQCWQLCQVTCWPR